MGEMYDRERHKSRSLGSEDSGITLLLDKVDSLDRKFDALARESVDHKIEMAKRMAEGTAWMQNADRRLQQVENVVSELPGLTVQMRQLLKTFENVNMPSVMRDLEEIRKANPVGTASTVHRIIEEAKEKKKPHWALVAAGTALIAGIIGAMVAAWVKIPSAPDAKPIPPADPGKGTQP